MVGACGKNFQFKTKDRKCDQCGMKFFNALHQFKHCHTKLPNPPFRCDKCKRVFKNAFNYFQHVVRPIPCDGFNSPFSPGKGEVQKKSQKQQKFKNKLPGKKGRLCRCPRCHKPFVASTYLHQHMKTCRLVQKQMIEKFASTESNVKRKRIFNCSRCNKKFADRKLLERHLVNHRQYSCSFCSQQFLSYSLLSSHLLNHHREHCEFKCRSCKQPFSSYEDCLRHMKQCHPNLSLNNYYIKKKVDLSSETVKEPNDINSRKRTSTVSMDSSRASSEESVISIRTSRKSKSTSRSFTISSSVDSASNHMSYSELFSVDASRLEDSPTDEGFTCGVCEKRLQNVVSFVYHRLLHFTNDIDPFEISDTDPYTCEICSEKIERHALVQMHLVEHLQGLGTSSLGKSKVKKVTNSHNSLAGKEMEMHSAQEFLCSMCGRVFPNKEECVIHSKRDCSRNNSCQEVALRYNYKCSFCSLKFSTEFECKCHEMGCKKILDSEEPSFLSDTSFTQGMNSEVSSSALNNDPPANLACRLFLKSLDSRHKKEQAVAYICNSCDASFPSKSKLIEHEKANHKFSIPLSCSICLATFLDLPALREHMDMHEKRLRQQELLKQVKDNGDILVIKEVPNCCKENCLFYCSHCPDCIKFSKHLEEHIKSHKSVCLKSGISPTKFFKSKQSRSSEMNDSIEYNSEDEMLLNELREQFSFLFFSVINNSEVLNQLGWGEKLIDAVLENALKILDQQPVKSDGCLGVFKQLEANIRIFLNTTLRDEVEKVCGNVMPIDELVRHMLAKYANNAVVLRS